MTEVNLISKFDPWDSTLCTCPPKLTFNPYTGCDHACTYCYASSYIPKFSNCRPKKDLVPRLKREAAGLKGEIVSIANSSDPYPSIEAESGLTRKCLEILSNCDCKLQMITKSDLVVRDIGLLRKVPSMVSLTITTDDDKVARIIEPQAPSPSQRLKAARTLIKRNIPTSVRIDPIIPFINDNPETLMKTLARMGVKHVTCSTYKIKRDNWQRFKPVYPEVAKRLEPFYFEKGEKIGGYTYLPWKLRLELMMAVRGMAEKYGMHFGVCREDLSRLNTASCDGSWMLYT